MGRAFEYRRAAKEKRWGNMSRIFPKLAKIITIAAKEGGSDPDMNPKLRTAILNAKAQNMPKDNIEAAIKRASGKDASEIMEVTYEGKAPHGVQLIIECATDNQTRTVANVKAILKKGGAEPLKNGSLDFMFNRKSVFKLAKNDAIDLEELELELIDAGLEELEVDEDEITIYGAFESFGTLSKAIEDNEALEVKKAELQRIPTSPIELSDEQMEEIESLIDKLEEDDDVQFVFTNIG
ncbi:MAG: YebC/PmpR family DNA-binding transcriptional regulator [Campylobacterales bacterium]|nr:YebC/PmpR family DNA-binding transcriptional regulator [Campylobacterales bacterium]